MNLQEAYSILKISSKSTLDDIKHAYKKRALETHPDRGGKASDFVKVRAAYEILLKYFQTNVNEKPDDFDIPIPNELRNVINDIVNGFSHIYYGNSNNIHTRFAQIHNEISSYIYGNNLQTLGSTFSGFFENKVYSTIKTIIDDNNKQTQYLMQSYEKWFSSRFNELNNEIYAITKFNYWKSLNFLVSVLLFFVIAYLGYFYDYLWLGLFIGIIILIQFYTVTIKMKAESTQRIKPRDFNFNFDKVSSLSSNIAEHVRGFTTASQIAAWSGIRSNDLATGIAGVLIGTAISFIGELTGGSKKGKLLAEASKTLCQIEEDFSRFYLKEMQIFLDELQNNIANNYKERNKNYVLLLTQN